VHGLLSPDMCTLVAYEKEIKSLLGRLFGSEPFTVYVNYWVDIFVLLIDYHLIPELSLYVRGTVGLTYVYIYFSYTIT
jgi:hypothetical protein